MPAAPHRLAALLGVFAAAPALAQHPGAEPVEEVIVSAPYARAQAEMLQATSVLSGEGLDRALAATLGETLAHLPGVSSSYFGPGASRPIIRGLGGERVRVLIDGIGAIDASNTSPDHAVAGEPVTAERIEVVRGPASLLYGSSAAGGVVNVIDGRIPAAMPEKGAAGTLFGRYASNDDEAATAASLTLGAGAHVAVHADGFYRDTGDIRVPGVRGPLANTDTETYGGAAGVSYVFERGFFGVSAANFQSDYGVPTAEGQEEAAAVDAAAGGVRIDLDQIRVDVKGRLGLDGFFKEAKLRFGYGDYEHRELEGGVTGTRFLNEGWEGRLELVQRGTRGHRGAVGMQVRRRDFEAIGAEAFVPPNATTQLGLFTVQEVDLGPARIELSGRYEHVATDNRALAVQRRFDPISVSAGLSYDWADGVRTALNLYRTERAPAAEELFSDGPHLATAAFEVGDPALAKEVARGGEASLRIEAESVSFTLTGFFTDYRDFIFEAFTGDEEDGLPVLAFAQASARFLGGEAEAAARLYDGPIWQVRADLAADIVRATNRAQDEPLPRIPPKSLLVGLGAFSNAVDARLDVELAASQNRIGARESATPGYAALHADLTWHPLGQAGGLRVILQGRNLTDSVMRRHTSFLKDILPLPGRSVRLAARLDF